MSGAVCAICFEVPRNPCQVPCGNNHVFCLSCIHGMARHITDRQFFLCPCCRGRVDISPGGSGFRRSGPLSGSVSQTRQSSAFSPFSSSTSASESADSYRSLTSFGSSFESSTGSSTDGSSTTTWSSSDGIFQSPDSSSYLDLPIAEVYSPSNRSLRSPTAAAAGFPTGSSEIPEEALRLSLDSFSRDSAAARRQLSRAHWRASGDELDMDEVMLLIAAMEQQQEREEAELLRLHLEINNE